MTPQHGDSTERKSSTECIDRVEYVDIHNRDLERVDGGGVDLDMPVRIPNLYSRNPGDQDPEPGRATDGSIVRRNPGG